MNNLCILIRDPDDEYGEKAAMMDLGIDFYEGRAFVPPNSMVIGRYSFNQFRFCSDLGNWYSAICHFTPKTWFSLQAYLNDSYEGPVVLKGETNSRRDKWKTHMFANNKEETKDVYCRLMDDSLISQQQIYIRKFEPFKKLIDGVNEMPIPNEWRIFVCNKKIVSCSYYWGTYLEDIKELGINPERPPEQFINDMIYFIGNNSNFYSMDIAQKDDGSWMVVEINEGQMSGLNGLDPKEFYTSLMEVL
jgi:hypothetical protein